MTFVVLPAADRFAYIMGVLCQAVAARGAVIGPIHILIWKRLSRTGQRFARLVARVRSGELPSARPAGCRARQAKRRKSDDPTDRPVERLPRGLAWLLRLVPEAAVYGSQLNHLLSDPEMVALLTAAPQMGRLLRPLCQMLGIRLSDHPLLQPARRMREAASGGSASVTKQPGGGWSSPHPSLRAEGEAIHDQPARTKCTSGGSPRRFALRDEDVGSIQSHRNRSCDSAAAADSASGDAVAPERKSARTRRPAETLFYAGLQPPVRLPDVRPSGEPPPWAERIRPIRR